MKRTGLLLVLTTLTVAPATAANLIKNASFEFPASPDGSYTLYSTGQQFDHWLVVGAPGNIATVNSDFSYCGHVYNAKKGKQFVDLTGTSDTATGVQQTIPTKAGSTYVVGFNLGNIYDTSSNCGTTSTVDLVIDGENVASFTNKAGKDATDIVWKRFSMQFVAQSAHTTVAFINGDPSSDTANALDLASVYLVAAP